MKTNCPNCKREFDTEDDLGRFYENHGEDYFCLMCRYKGPAEFFKPAEGPKKSASKMTNEELKSARKESEDNKKNSKGAGSAAKSAKRGVRSQRASSDSSGGDGHNVGMAKDCTDGSVC